MLWCVIIGALAAFGALSALWVLAGLLLPKMGSVLTVCLCKPEQADRNRRRFRWLRELGLLQGSIVIVWDEADRIRKWEQELEHIDAAGIGNSPGHHRSGGVSKL